MNLHHCVNLHASYPCIRSRSILGGIAWLPLVQRMAPVRGRQAPCHTTQSQASRSPKAGHNKAGWSDFRSQRFEPDTGKMRKAPPTPEKQKKQRSEEIPLGEDAENAKNVVTKTDSTRRRRGKCEKCGHENAEDAADWL